MKVDLSADVLDVLVTDDGTSAVMVGTRVLVLAPLPTLLVGLIQTGTRDLATLARRLDALAGPPVGTSAQAATEALIGQLEGAGVVAVSH